MFRRRRGRRRLIIGLVVLVCIAAPVTAALLILHNLDLTRYKDEIAGFMKETTGREFQIAGHIDASLSLSPEISARDITFGNASWGTAPVMVKVDHLTAAFSLWPLIFGTFQVERLTLSGGQIRLETDAEGRGNWDIKNADDVIDEGDEYIELRYQSFAAARIENMNVEFRDGETGAIASGDVETLELSASAPNQDLTLQFDGKVEGQQWRLEAKTGSLRELSQSQKVRFKANAEIGSAALSVDGQAEDLIGFAGVDFKLAASGPGMADLFELTDIAMPDTGPFNATATLMGSSGKGYDVDFEVKLTESAASLTAQGRVSEILTFQDFDLNVAAAAPEFSRLGPILGINMLEAGPLKLSTKLGGSKTELNAKAVSATLGQSDASGSVSWRYGTVPRISVDLTSAVVDVTPFLPEIDRDVEAPSQDTTKSGRIFSDRDLPFDVLGKVDADISLNVNRLVIRDARIDLAHTRIDLNKGSLRVDPLEIDYLKSTATARIGITLGETPETRIELLLQDFDLGQLLSETKVTDLVKGEVDVGADVTGRGRSVQDMVGGLDGHVGLVMGEGEIASKYIDLIAVDLTKFLMPWRKGVDDAKIKCALAQFEITKGLAKTTSLLFDTRDMTMTGKGSINLQTEKIDFFLSPRPKDPSLFSLATDLRVGGTLSDPTVAPDALSVVGEVAEAVVGVLLLGPAGFLVPFASLGAGHHHPCVNDLQKTFGDKIASEIKQQPN
ncbi:MAG: AsmA family protein [Alphaproteobacteria bacterium]|nr:AsmA family protein [Alphaproteobacteria bacterium]